MIAPILAAMKTLIPDFTLFITISDGLIPFRKLKRS